MRGLLVILLLIVGIVLAYIKSNPPVTGADLFVPMHALERLGLNEEDLFYNKITDDSKGDLFYKLSDDSSCTQKFGEHNYTNMFYQLIGKRDGIRVWNQHVTLYLTWSEAWQIEDEIYLCIRFKNKWEAAWKGKYNLSVKHKTFFCNKENLTTKWECHAYDLGRSKMKKIEIFKLLTKYSQIETPNKSFKSGSPKSGAPYLKR